MRRDIWFRGALLSVLFFCLILGAAPSYAGLYDGCTYPGCTSKHRFTDGSKHAEACAAFKAATNVGAAMAGVGAVMSLFGPAGLGAGLVVGTAGVITSGLGATAQMMGGC